MQESYEEPTSIGAGRRSPLFSGAIDTGNASVTDTMYLEESLFTDRDDSNMYIPSQRRRMGTSLLQRPSTPLGDDRMMRDMAFRSQALEQSDTGSASRIRSLYNRTDLSHNENSLFLDSLSPIPTDLGSMSRSRLHSPMNNGDYGYSHYRNGRDLSSERLSPMAPEPYRRRFPPSCYDNDYYSDTNLSPFRLSPVPPREYYSPNPMYSYDNAGEWNQTRFVNRRRSPIPPEMGLRYCNNNSSVNRENEQEMTRNLSWMNMTDESIHESDGSMCRAKSLMCMNDYEDMDPDEMHKPKSRTISICNPDVQESVDSDHIPSNKDEKQIPGIPLEEKKVDGVNSSHSVEEDKDSSYHTNEMDAIFASCNQKESDEQKKAIKPVPQPEKPKQKKKQHKKSKSEVKKDDQKQKSPCRDFENGVCSRGASCKFYHDPAKAVRSPDKIPICKDFMNGDCKRDRCRFRHPGTHNDNVLMGIDQPSSPAELQSILKRYSSTLVPFN